MSKGGGPAAGDAGDWNKERERSRATQARKSAEGRDIAPLPRVLNPARKARARESFECFCREYFPNTFNLPWSGDHREAIALIETVVRCGGQLAYAMPRGSGKTSLAEAAVLWSTLFGFRQFALVIGSDATSAEEILDSVKNELESNDELLADFPEVCYPIRRIEGIAHRCNGQIFDGKRTHMHWASDCVVLPTMPNSAATGCIINVAGLTGRIRGMKHKRADGSSVRPDLVLLDDPQTDESARSPSQCTTRKRLVNGAVLGLAGPGKKIAALMPCTVVAQGDLSDELLDRDKNPQWRGKRTAMVVSWATNTQLWDQYAEIRRNSLRAGNEGREATEFYRANREQMDAGFVVSWPARKHTSDLSGQQHAMNLRLDLGDSAFFAEYQNAPLVEQQGEEMLTAGEIAKKLNGIKRGIVPLGRDLLTAFIDIQGDYVFYVVVAWSRDFTGSVIDYGTWPDQKTDYFAKRDVRRTFKKEPALSKMGKEAQIYAALEKCTEQILGREYTREGDGVALSISKCPIDANWGSYTKVVKLFCRQSKYKDVVIPSFGRFVGAAAKPWDQYSKRDGETLGNHWMLPKVERGAKVRTLHIDTNWWKSFVHTRLRVGMGDPGCLALYGRDPDAHRMISEHLTAEYFTKKNGVDEWKALPGKPDNEGLDCIVGAAVVASMLGCAVLEGDRIGAKKKKKPTRKRVHYMN